MKRFWTYIKHRTSDNVGVSSLKSEGKLYSHPTDKADILNKQFQSVFSSSESVSEEEFSKSYPMPTTEDQFPVIEDIDITLNGIVKLLKDLNPTKSPGPDNLSQKVLKETANEVGPLLLLIYRKSLQTSEVPEDWRKANVAPVFKKGQRYQAENYRPISLTIVCCKIVEHIVASNIMNHDEDNNILYPLQHGFRRARSCETQLIEFIDDLTSSLDEGQQVDILVIDFAKAFDKVCQSLLIHKLHHYGIRGKINSWIKSWLANRTQSIVIDGEHSESVSVESGVPQGSVLGPGLFLYYINDLPEGLNSIVRLFADNTIAYLVIVNPQDAEKVQDDLTTMGFWEVLWKMKFHATKCNVITVTGKRKPLQTEYKLHDHTLAKVTSAKYLGVTITEDLKWDTHINDTCAKANRTLGFLRRNLNIGSVSIKQQAYFILVRPLVEYASTVWDPHTQRNIQKLEMVQRRAARYVTNRHRNRSSESDMLHGLNWRSLQDRRKDARLCMLYKVDRRLVAIKKDRRLISPKRKTRSKFQTIGCKTDRRKMSFFPRTVLDWNALPPDIQELDSLCAFKARVSTM